MDVTQSTVRLVLAIVFALLSACSEPSAPNAGISPGAATSADNTQSDKTDCTVKRNGTITITGAWIRATASTKGPSAAFFDICNSSSKPVALISVTSPIAGTTELHTTIRRDNGIVSMQPIQTLVVAGGAKASFEPGADHVMLMALKQVIRSGDQIPLTLTFDNGEKLTVDARAATPAEAIKQ